MKTAEVLKVLEDQGWSVIREDGTHKILKKGQVKLPFAYHERELGGPQIRKLAHRFQVDLNEFFRSAPQPRPTIVDRPKPVEVITPRAITEGPIAGAARLVFLSAGSLQVDHRYQRPLNAQWARWLAENWDDRMLGVLTVSEREDGSFWLLEGQHRSAALVSLGVGDRKVACIAFKNLSLKEEADIYLGRNTAKQQTTLALYHAKLAMSDPAALEIRRVVSDVYKLQIVGSGTHTVNAIGTLFRLVEWDALSGTFVIWHAAWGDQKNPRDTLRSPILLAIGAMVRYYGKQLDADRLAAQLRPYSGAELMYMALGRTNAMRRGATYVAMAEAMRNIYNVRLKESALPPIDLTSTVVSKWSTYTTKFPAGTTWGVKLS